MMEFFLLFFVLVTSVCFCQVVPLQNIVSYEDVADICRNRISGNFPHPNPARCDLFVRCSLFQSNVETCNINTIYNLDTRNCQPGNQKTCEFHSTVGSNTQTPSTTEISTTAALTTTEASTTTDELTTTTEASTTSTQIPSTTPSLNDRCSNIMGVGAIPNPDNCGSFVLCIFGKPEIRMCEDNEIYIVGSMGCVPGNQMTCEIGTVETTTHEITTTGEATTTTESQTSTIEVHTTTTTTIEVPTTTIEVPTTTIKTTIVVPTTSTTTTMEVPTTSTTTKIESTTTPPTTTVENSTTQPPAEICIGNNFRFIPDPSSCYRYFYCLLNVPLAAECAQDRIFDPTVRLCVLGDRETCKKRNFIELFFQS